MVFIIGIIVSFILYIAIGAILSKNVKNTEDFYISGRSGSTLMVTGTLVASFLSTVSFMGEAGFSYEGYPIPLLILVIFNGSGYIFGVFLFGRYLRRSKSLTVPEYFGNRFNSRKVRLIAAITTVIGIAAYLVAVTQGSSLLLSEIFNIPYAIAIVIMCIVFASFTVMSGAKGVMVNDTIMFFIFSLAAYVSFPFIIKATGGFPAAIMKAANNVEKPNIFSWHGVTGSGAYMGSPTDVLIWAVIMGLVWGSVVAISPWQSSRYLMAKNEHVAIRSGVWATISIFTIYIFLHSSMAMINNVNSSIHPTEKVFIWAAMHLVPSWLGVIIVSGIMAAALSSCATFLQLIGSSIANDIIQPFSKKKYSDQKLLSFSRISMIMVTLIILIIGIWQPPAVMWIGYFAATLFAASWGPVAFSSVFSKTVTSLGAFWSIIAGFLGVIAGEAIGTLIKLPIYLHPVIIGFILSSITLYVVSKFGVITEEEVSYQRMLHQQPMEENEKREMAITKRYPTYLIISGIAVVIITFVFYYWPISHA
ncbi:Na+/proline symporter [Lysinibacillus sp. RC46]|uniref:sodium:solute symporter family protein n=1 Tax=unclassified Lysinibacillus TaxID=2636778 RepID=UPI0035162617